jgi:hypothetical protein
LLKGKVNPNQTETQKWMKLKDSNALNGVKPTAIDLWVTKLNLNKV